MEHQHSKDVPRDDDGNCAVCHQPIREEAGPKPKRKRRPRIVITPPEGEEGELEDLLAQLAEKYETVWPDQIVPVGGQFWMYRAIHFAAYAALTANLVPSAEGG